MRFLRTEHFREAYRSLPADIRQKVDKALMLMASDPRHPSLRIKKMKGSDVWEARVDRSHRMTFEIGDGYYLMRNVGKHDETLDRP